MTDKRIIALQAKLQSSSREFSKIENDLAAAVEARQRLDAQQSENQLVLKEFQTLKPHNTIYKLTGPALVPQDREEAQQQVENRLKFIKSEIERVEAQLQEHQEKANKKKNEIITLQEEFQALQGPSGGQRAVAA